jgi:hypothetical protein
MCAELHDFITMITLNMTVWSPLDRADGPRFSAARASAACAHRRRNGFKSGTAQVWDCGAGGAKRPRALPKAALGVGAGGGSTPYLPRGSGGITPRKFLKLQMLAG